MIKITKKSLYGRIIEDITLHLNYLKSMKLKKPFDPETEIIDIFRHFTHLRLELIKHMSNQMKILEKQNGNQEL